MKKQLNLFDYYSVDLPKLKMSQAKKKCKCISVKLARPRSVIVSEATTWCLLYSGEKPSVYSVWCRVFQNDEVTFKFYDPDMAMQFKLKWGVK